MDFNPDQDHFSLFNTNLKTLKYEIPMKHKPFLPSVLEGAIIYLKHHHIKISGIFRKSGVKSRITNLRNESDKFIKFVRYRQGLLDQSNSIYNLLDQSQASQSENSSLAPNQHSNSPINNSTITHQTIKHNCLNHYHIFQDKILNLPEFENVQPYDIADFIKQWYRSLNEPLIPDIIVNNLLNFIETIKLEKLKTSQQNSYNEKLRSKSENPEEADVNSIKDLDVNDTNQTNNNHMNTSIHVTNPSLEGTTSNLFQRNSSSLRCSSGKLTVKNNILSNMSVISDNNLRGYVYKLSKNGLKSHLSYTEFLKHTLF